MIPGDARIRAISLTEVRIRPGAWRRRRPGEMGTGFSRFSALFEMLENLFDDRWIFDTGNNLDATATMLTGYNVDIECFNRCAQVVAVCGCSGGLVSLFAVGLQYGFGVIYFRNRLFGANTAWNRVKLIPGPTDSQAPEQLTLP